MTKPARIGDILRTLTGLTDEQVAEAGAYKFEHDDILLGEACVRLGFVSRASLEAAVAIQQARSNGGCSGLLQLAIDRTRSNSARTVAQVAVGVALVEKLTS